MQVRKKTYLLQSISVIVISIRLFDAWEKWDTVQSVVIEFHTWICNLAIER